MINFLSVVLGFYFGRICRKLQTGLFRVPPFGFIGCANAPARPYNPLRSKDVRYSAHVNNEFADFIFWSIKMVAIIFGLLLIAFCIYAALPQGLDWGTYILIALKGDGPLLAVLVGIAAILIGFADIQDKKEARKEEREAKEEAEKESRN